MPATGAARAADLHLGEGRDGVWRAAHSDAFGDDVDPKLDPDLGADVDDTCMRLA